MADLLEASRGDALALDDVDFDNDARELIRTAGQARLIDLATAVLRSDRGDAPPAAADSLAPEVEAALALPFLRLFAVNVAFRFRTDALLADLLAFAAAAPPPRPDPAQVAALIARARPEAEARALVEASPLEGAARQAALEAARPPTLPRLGGARLHVEAEREALEKALAKALRPAKPIPWPLAATSLDARKFIALRARGGWITLLAEGERPDPDLARALAREAGIGRAAWACLDAAAPDLRVFDGTQTVVDAASLADRVGRTPTGDDVAGALRALGVLDLDPEHPRGLPALAFNAYADSPLRQQGAWGIALG